MNGYLVRDGVLGELIHGERRVLERRRGAPQRVVLDAEDDRGRSLHAEGHVRTALRWFGWPGRLAFWTLTEWQWDDHRRKLRARGSRVAVGRAGRKRSA
jgi:hypothetical protein